MAVYLLKQGTIETNNDGEIVGVSRAYIHLLGRDISDAVRRPELQGIKKSPEAHQETRLPFVQKEQRGFRQYGKHVLPVEQSNRRREH